MRMFEYTNPSVYKKLNPEQRVFVSKIIMRDVQKASKEYGITEETAYWGYCRGLYGGDRTVPLFNRFTDD